MLAGLPVTQAPPPAPGCYLLTTQEIATLVGSAAPHITTTTGNDYSTCIYQNDDAVVTVKMVKGSSADAARQQWEANKRAAAAQDIAGWPTPAYRATVDTATVHAAIVGVYSSLTLVEAGATDPTQKTTDLAAKLQTVMKAYSARLAAQK